VRRYVLDPARFLEWFEPGADAEGLRAEYEAGRSEVHVPRRFEVDLLTAVAASDADAGRLERLALELERVGFIAHDAPPSVLARCLERGVSSDRLPYVALAEHLELPLLGS
jgi:hypothetical protein